MKAGRFAIYFLSSIVFFAACKKDNAKNNSNTSTSIIGEWELRYVSAAMNPHIYNYPPGNGNKLKFTDQRYEAYENGQLVKSGSYAVVEDPTVEENVCLVFPANKFTRRIIYDTVSVGTKPFIEISNDTLTIVAGCYAFDAGRNMQYVRITENN